jgi:hypothetical protein
MEDPFVPYRRHYRLDKLGLLKNPAAGTPAPEAKVEE